MATKFRIHKKGSKDSKIVGKKAAVEWVIESVGKGKVYYARMRGEPDARWKRYKPQPYRKLTANLLGAAETGETYVFWRKGRKALWVVRAIEVQPQVALPAQSADWPPEQKRLYRHVYGTKWANGKPAYYGTCNCRPPRGSSSGWSDHACCGALDVGVGSNKKLGDEIYRDLMKHRDRFNIRYISWCGIQIKTECGSGLHGDHLHVSTRQCSGCA